MNSTARKRLAESTPATLAPFFIKPDADRDPTVWRRTDSQPEAIVRMSQVGSEAWSLIVLGVLAANGGSSDV